MRIGHRGFWEYSYDFHAISLMTAAISSGLPMTKETRLGVTAGTVNIFDIFLGDLFALTTPFASPVMRAMREGAVVI
jgi:hypothetical protein